MYVPVIPTPPSAQARELGGLIAQVVKDYKAENPDIRSDDVREAFTVARDELGPAAGSQKRLIVLLLIGCLTLGAGVLVYYMRASGGGGGGGGTGAPTQIPWVLVLIVVGAVVAAATAVMAARR